MRTGNLCALGRWAEADAAVDESINLHPTHVFNQFYKATCSVQFERGAEARRFILTARRLGYELAHSERIWRRVLPNSPTLESDIAIFRALYAATEPGS